jgi:CheY-like chemotaxis protein
MQSAKKILLVDTDDMRRKTRVQMLAAAGYEVEVRADHEVAERLDHEPVFDLVVLALHSKKLEEAAAYSERLRKKHPTLPILLLMDAGVFAPHGTLSESIETGAPLEMMKQIAEMLAGSSHIREIAD